VQFIQLDIQPTEIDSNRAIAAPVVGDIESSVTALLSSLKPGEVKPSAPYLNQLAQHKKTTAAFIAVTTSTAAVARTRARPF
jgi:oxalyl-CoA decarboxylase